ncbi:DUF7519 family protein [Haloarchaeobius amylolyticus]|uniref:DUF7519 family protein n=1 Tax=Haloarchaeobius amylolyticus TaxID=1198296 RepID=UPI00226E18D1|nr:hypothetical protein [Haloarchaeobius amylolyticus]
MTAEIDHRPARLSAMVALGAGAFAALAAILTASVGVLGGALGMLALAPGVVLGSRRLVHLGAVGLLAGLVFAGATGTAPSAELLMLVGTTATVLAWDVGQNAIGLGEQLGREAETTRAELAHIGGSAVVGTLTGGVAYAVYQVATEGQPVSALALLLLAVVILTTALRQ